MTSTLYRSGSIYSPGSPRATALLIDSDGGAVVWVGTDEAAGRLGAPDVEVDLAGALLAPAFVDAAVRCTPTGLALLGIGERTGLSDDERRAACEATRSEAARLGIGSLHELVDHSAEGAADLRCLAGAEGVGPEVIGYQQLDGAAVPAGDLLRQFVSDTKTGHQTSVTAPDAAAVVRVAGVASRAAVDVGLASFVRARHRLDGLGVDRAGELSREVLAELARLGLVVTVVSTAGTGEPARPALRDLAAAGVPFALGSGAPAGPLDPWESVRAASVPHCDGALSARAAFAAATRGGRRAARQDGAGVLRPGAPATFAVWQFSGDLVVQAPDSRVAAWSTDPRASTPGLPELAEGAATPRCLQTVVDGRIVFDDTRGG